MSNRKFVEEFNVKVENPTFDEASDYNAFPDKVLLEELRNKIIQDLIDSDLTTYSTTDDYVKEEINKVPIVLTPIVINTAVNIANVYEINFTLIFLNFAYL